MTKGPKIAIFDFDDTLIEGDSLWPFLAAVKGRPFAFWALALAALSFLKAKILKIETETMRSAIKRELTRRILAGFDVKNLAPAVNKLKAWRRWKEPLRHALIEQHKMGCRIVIASGALDLYLPFLLEGLPPCDLICTRMAIKEGIITGEWAGPNCVREDKARLVKNFLTEQGPFGESFGYGNLPHDRLMLALTDHPTVVR